MNDLIRSFVYFVLGTLCIGAANVEPDSWFRFGFAVGASIWYVNCFLATKIWWTKERLG